MVGDCQFNMYDKARVCMQDRGVRTPEAAMARRDSELQRCQDQMAPGRVAGLVIPQPALQRPCIALPSPEHLLFVPCAFFASV